jgi:hypothetical protein
MNLSVLSAVKNVKDIDDLHSMLSILCKSHQSASVKMQQLKNVSNLTTANSGISVPAYWEAGYQLVP